MKSKILSRTNANNVNKGGDVQYKPVATGRNSGTILTKFLLCLGLFFHSFSGKRLKFFLNDQKN